MSALDLKSSFCSFDFLFVRFSIRSFENSDEFSGAVFGVRQILVIKKITRVFLSSVLVNQCVCVFNMNIRMNSYE